MKDFAINCCEQAGQVLLEYYGKVQTVSSKGDISNVVTEADLAAENLIANLIKESFPNDSIIGEETGHYKGESNYTWIIDPLDGTSNFAANIPWFGVLLGRLEGVTPVQGVIHLPTETTTYYAESEKGAFRNGEKIQVSQESSIANVLWAYGMDATEDSEATEREIRLLSKVKNVVRNVRTTNSLIDGCFVSDGRFGGIINQCVKIWDIAGPCVVLKEAGALVTDLSGQDIMFDLEDYLREYQLLCGPPKLHAEMLGIMSAP